MEGQIILCSGLLKVGWVGKVFPEANRKAVSVMTGDAREELSEICDLRIVDALKHMTKMPKE